MCGRAPSPAAFDLDDSRGLIRRPIDSPHAFLQTSFKFPVLCSQSGVLTSRPRPCYVQIPSGLNMIRSYKGKTPTVPNSCYVDDSAQLIGDVVLGEHASIWMNAVLRGDVHAIRVGAYSNVQDGSVLHGMKEQYGVFLGGYVTVGHSVILHGCTIEDRCLIGMGSIILNGARIGAGSIIAAGTLIPEKTIVEPGSLWMGSPGKFKRKLEEKDQETIMRYARNYLEYKESYLRER